MPHEGGKYSLPMLNKERKLMRTGKTFAQRIYLTTGLMFGAMVLVFIPSLFMLDVINDGVPSTEGNRGWEPTTLHPDGVRGRFMQVKPSWVVAHEQENVQDLVKRNIQLLEERIKVVLAAESHATVLDQKCHFVFPLNRHVNRLEYLFSRNVKTYMRRPNAFFDVVRQQIGEKLFVFMEPLPSIWRPMPIALSPSFNISKKFGAWRTFFKPSLSPITEVVTNVSNKPLWSISRDASYHSMQLSEGIPPMYVVMFTNAVTSSGHVITCGGNVYTAGGCLSHWYLPRITQAAQLDWFSVVIPLCDEWCKGYFHFTHEHLVRLSLVHSILLERSDAILILYSPQRGFHTQWLVDVLGIPSSRIRYERRPAHAHLVLYPTPNPCGSAFVHLLYAMRRIVFERLQLGTTPLLHENIKRKHHFIFAERAGRSRMPTNYDVLKKKLMTEYESVMSFTTIASGFSVVEQIRAFYKADIVLGPHGANLANALWMRRGTHLIEILSYSDGNMCYYATATSINVTHHTLFHSSSKEGSYSLDYDYLKRHVEYALQMMN